MCKVNVKGVVANIDEEIVQISQRKFGIIFW